MRELSRLVRDLMVVAIDPSRLADPTTRPMAIRARHGTGWTLLARGSAAGVRLLAEAEDELRTAAQPRYHLEMALLKWIDLRKLVPIDELIQTVERGGGGEPPRGARPASPARPLPSEPPRRGPSPRNPPRAGATIASVHRHARRRRRPRRPRRNPSRNRPRRHQSLPVLPHNLYRRRPSRTHSSNRSSEERGSCDGTAVAQASRIDVGADAVTFVFAPQHRVLREQIEQKRSWLENIASELAGHRMRIVLGDIEPPAPSAAPIAAAADPKESLRQKALGDNAVQAMLDVFPAEITDVREVDG